MPPSSPEPSPISSNAPSQDGSNISKQEPGRSGSSSQQHGNVKPQSPHVITETPKTSRSQKSQNPGKPQMSPAAGSKSPTQKHPGNQQLHDNQQRRTIFPAGDPKKANSDEPQRPQSGLQASYGDKPQLQQVDRPLQQQQTQHQPQKRVAVTTSSQIAPTNHDRKEVKPELTKNQIKHRPPDIQHQSPSGSVPRMATHHSQHLQSQPPSTSLGGSFGYKPLTSVEVPLTGAATEGFGGILKNMPPPDPNDMGPTIQPPSDSLSDPVTDEKSLKKKKPLNSKDNNPNVHTLPETQVEKPPGDVQNSQMASKSAERSYEVTKNSQIAGGQSLEKQMSDLRLNNKVQQTTKDKSVNPSAKQTTISLDDLETDAPEEENSISLKEGSQPPPVKEQLMSSQVNVNVKPELRDRESNRSIFANPKDAQLFEDFEPLPITGRSKSPTKQCAKRVAPPPGFASPMSQMPQSPYAPLATTGSSKLPAKQSSDQYSVLQPGFPSQTLHQRHQTDMSPLHISTSDSLMGFNNKIPKEFDRRAPGSQLSQHQGIWSDYSWKAAGTWPQTTQGSPSLTDHLGYPAHGIDAAITKSVAPNRPFDPTPGKKKYVYNRSPSDDNRSTLFQRKLRFKFLSRKQLTDA